MEVFFPGSFQVGAWDNHSNVVYYYELPLLSQVIHKCNKLFGLIKNQVLSPVKDARDGNKLWKEVTKIS